MTIIKPTVVALILRWLMRCMPFRVAFGLGHLSRFQYANSTFGKVKGPSFSRAS
jgi:hypothetical protein